MDEREDWRPKIFYSKAGPEQGLPEPFPSPTHLRRKERSSFNRGALYVPVVSQGRSSTVYQGQCKYTLGGDREERTYVARCGSDGRDRSNEASGGKCDVRQSQGRKGSERHINA
jgi:hypothetical protein